MLPSLREDLMMVIGVSDLINIILDYIADPNPLLHVLDWDYYNYEEPECYINTGEIGPCTCCSTIFDDSDY
jgi:hypothetical protein